MDLIGKPDDRVLPEADEPFRGELLGSDRLTAAARELARGHRYGLRWADLVKSGTSFVHETGPAASAGFAGGSGVMRV